ncbi:hypothetical protein [Sutcliffiella cohnii]|uniref:hypothetical protein n=1 Tax=Sutcliffiella cohnii TaxID=33932 RepID=UPI000A6803B8|nr:hypothetical protein [Sutcliffiella cohnii]
MMDYQYRRKALQSLKTEKEEVKQEFKNEYAKSKSLLATIISFFPFVNHSS